MNENLEKYIKSLPILGLFISIFDDFILFHLESRREFIYYFCIAYYL